MASGSAAPNGNVRWHQPRCLHAVLSDHAAVRCFLGTAGTHRADHLGRADRIPRRSGRHDRADPQGAKATLGITRVLRLPLQAHADEATRRRRRWIIGAAVLLTVVPSIYLATQLVRDEWFASRAQRFVAALEDDDRNLVVLDSNIDPRRRLIQITPLGEPTTLELQRNLEARLPAFGLADATLEIRGPATRPTSAAASSVDDAQRRIQVQIQEHDTRLGALEARLGEAQSEVADLSRLGEEIRAQWPNAQRVQVLQAADSTPADRRLIVLLERPRAVPPQEVTRLERWLAVRVPDSQIELVVGHKVGTVNPDATDR